MKYLHFHTFTIQKFKTKFVIFNPKFVPCINEGNVRRGKKDQISDSNHLYMYLCTHFVVMKKKVELFDNVMFEQSKIIRGALESS